MLQTDAGPAVTARLPARASWMAGAPLAFGTSAPSRLVPVLHVVMGTPGAGVCEPASRRARIGSESEGGQKLSSLGDRSGFRLLQGGANDRLRNKERTLIISMG